MVCRKETAPRGPTEVVNDIVHSKENTSIFLFACGELQAVVIASLLSLLALPPPPPPSPRPSIARPSPDRAPT